jgi:hypothetical protein
VELGNRRLPGFGWRPPRGTVLAAAAALLIGLIVGYVAGDRQARHGAGSLSSPGSAPPAATFPTGIAALSQSSSQCAAQIGSALQLGVQVTNESATALTLRRVEAILPLGGLKATAQAWGPCGALPGAGAALDDVLPGGASTWFTVTFRVLVKCPAAFPVQFILDYDQHGRAATAHLPGFADLGGVPYAGCPVS